MTFIELKQILKENNIPEDVELMSDSGWECDATGMDDIFYCVDANVLVFTQGHDTLEDVVSRNSDIGTNWKHIECTGEE